MSRTISRRWFSVIIISFTTLIVTTLFSLPPASESVGIHGKVTAGITSLRDYASGRKETEQILDGDIFHFIRETTSSTTEPSLLWLLVTKDEESWGHNDDAPVRSFSDFLQIVKSSAIPLPEISLGLLTSSKSEYAAYKALTRSHPFARVNVFLHPGNMDTTIPRGNRHDDNVQTRRRSEISQLRNFLMLKSLRAEQHILWLDADIYDLDAGIIQTMINHAETNSTVGLVTARCELGGDVSYDRNAWDGTRAGPKGWELADPELAKVEQEALGQRHVDKIVRDTNDDDILPLTTVGATILYIRELIANIRTNLGRRHNCLKVLNIFTSFESIYM